MAEKIPGVPGPPSAQGDILPTIDDVLTGGSGRQTIGQRHKSILGGYISGLQRDDIIPTMGEVGETFDRVAKGLEDDPVGAIFLQTSKGAWNVAEWGIDKWIRAQHAIGSVATVASNFVNPPWMKKTQKQKDLGYNPFTAFVKGVTLDPGSVRLGELFIPDEIADYKVPILHRLVGLRLGHLRMVPEVILEAPFGGAPGRLARTVKQVGKESVEQTVKLSPAGLARQAKVQELVQKRIQKATEARLKKAQDAGELKPDPRLTKTLDEQVIAEAHRASIRLSTQPVARIMGREVARDTSLLAERGVVHYGRTRLFSVAPVGDWMAKSKPWVSTAHIRSQIRNAADLSKTPATRLESALQPVFAGGGAFRETGRRALKRAPWIPQTLSQARHIQARSRSDSDRHIRKMFTGVSNDQRRAITDYMFAKRKLVAVAGSTDDAVRMTAERKAMETMGKLDDTSRGLIDEIDRMTAWANHIEGRQGVDMKFMEDYFPLRDRLNATQREMLDRRMVEHGYSTGPAKGDRTYLGDESFRYHREFDTPEDAIEAWRKMRLPWAEDAAKNPERYFHMDAAEALQRRMYEHSSFMADTHVMQTLMLRSGKTEKDVRKALLAYHFPEMLRADLRVTAQEGIAPLAGKSADRVADALKHDIELRGFTNVDGATRLTGDAAKNAQARVRGKLAQMSPEEQAWFLDGVSRNINSLTDVEDVMRLYGNVADGQMPAIARAKAKIRDARNEVLHDQWGTPFVAVKPSSVNTEVAGLYLPEAIATQIEGFTKQGLNIAALPGGEGIVKALRAYDIGLSRLKFHLTVPWPAFNTRNGYGDTSQGFIEIGLEMLNPKNVLDARRILLGHGGFVDVGDIKKPMQVVKEEVEHLGVITTANEMMELSGRGSTRVASTTRDKIKRHVTRPEETGIPRPITRALGYKKDRVTLGDLSADRENMGRLMLYLAQTRRGVAPEMASAYVTKVFFDYGALSPVEKGVMRRIFPFWVWNKKNVALQAKQLRDNPVRLIGQARIGKDDNGPNEAFYPDYARGDIKLGVESKRDGTFSSISGIDLPVNTAIQLTMPHSFREAFQTFVSNTSPVPKAIMDAWAYQRDPFTGADLSETGRTTLRAMAWPVKHIPIPGVKSYLEFQENENPRTGEKIATVNAARYHVFVRSMFLARYASTADRFARQTAKEGVGFNKALLDFLGGFKVHEYDLADRQVAMIKRNMRWMEREGQKEGVLYAPRVVARSKRKRVR